MKFGRDRLARAVRKVSKQAGRTCRTKLNTTGEEASQYWRGGVVEEKEETRGSRANSNGISKRENLQVLL
jgi:hypothetical protein